jgi:putative pyruvate formate lyase activating enzyme
MNLKIKIKHIEKIYPKLSKDLESCALCPRNCQINRIKNEKGYCGQDKNIKIYSSFLHFGEEPPISGKKGSGTIFFSGCSLRCVYCQNYKFSQIDNGKPVEEEKLAQIMLNLEKKGAQNINLVTPTHFLPQILKALKTAFLQGLNLPIVYNSSGYEKKEIVKLIEPIIDCWLLDFKYFSLKTGAKYSNSPKYPGIVKEVVSYLYNHKNGQNRPNRGQIPPIIIRHLALPSHIDESKEILTWIKKNTPKIPVSVMSQYQPYHQAKKFPKIARSLNTKEYNQVKMLVEKLELEGWYQESKPQENLAGIYIKEK